MAGKRPNVFDAALQELASHLKRIDNTIAGCVRLGAQLNEIESSLMDLKEATAARYRVQAEIVSKSGSQPAHERPPLLTVADLAKEFGVCRHTIASLRKKPGFPQSVQRGPRLIAFRREDVDRWLAHEREGQNQTDARLVIR